MFFHVLLFLITTILKQSDCQTVDPCQVYKQVPDIFRRLEQYTLSADEHQVNDYYLDDGWYGENGFDMLLEAPASPTACGTMNPIYLQGTLPVNVGEKVNRMACVIGWTGNCIVQLPVEVKRCTATLNVYYLRASTIVLSAYCFTRAGMNGTIAPAPNFNPNFVKVEVGVDWTEPIVSPRATIQFPLMVFSCSFSPVADNLYFQITWFVDNLRIKKGPVKKENITDLVINDIDLKNIGVTKLGFIVKCGVTALADAVGMPGDMKISDGFFAGIKIQTPRIELKRGQSVDVALYSTVPYGCAHVLNVPGRVDNCPGNIETYYTRGTSCKSAFGVVDSQGRRRRSAHRCGVQLKETKFNDIQPGVKTNWTQKYLWTIAQTDDGTYQLAERLFRVKLRVSAGTQHAIWNAYELDDIIVTVKDPTNTWQRKTCRAYCDPHMSTFDGSRYEMQKPGVYTFYKHKTRPVEVQLQSEPCVSGVTNAHCPCGVYVRGGSDLYILSTCTQHPFIDFLHCGDQSLQVVRNGDKTYKIILPTGAIVTVTMGYKWQINVVINAAPRDLNNVEGLCGNINGNRNDDFIVNGRDYGAITICGGGFKCRNQFIDLYKVSADKRFFPPTAENKNIFTLSPDQIVCTCPLDVAHGVAKSECSSKAFVKCKANREKQLKCTETNHRRKRDIEKRLLYIQDHLEKFSKALRRRRRSVSTTTITTEQARMICQAKFNNAGSFQYCQSNVAGIENTQEIENCIFDLNVTGITDWAEDALGAVTQQCTHEAEKNNTLQTSNNGAPSIAEVIEEITCPNECSGNGDCRNGTCFCNDEFTGSDCSFKKRQAPIVHPDVGDKLCDISDGPCTQINIFGEDFIDNYNLTCRIKEYQFNENGLLLRESSIIVQGDARSPFEVRCQIDRFRRRRQASSTNEIVFFRKYVISIANDGTLFGIEKDVYVADSTCQIQTNVSNIFRIKADYCFIDGKCVAKGDTLETDRHKVCLPANETFHWTHVEDVAPVITEPCEIYKEIPDLLKRLESYQAPLNEQQINDYYLEEGWYGKEGYDMLQKMPENSTACGTMGPIWLQGSLPDGIGTNVTGSACVTGWLPGCVLDIPVEIKNCSNKLNVYYLRASELTFSGYCFVRNNFVEESTTKVLTHMTSSTTTPTVTSTTTPTVTSTTTPTVTSTTTPTVTSTTTPQITSATWTSIRTSTLSTTSTSTRISTLITTATTEAATRTTLITSQSSNANTTQQQFTPFTPPVTYTTNTPSKETTKPALSSTSVLQTTTSKSNGNEEGQQGQNYLWVIAVVVVILVVIVIIIGIAVFVTKRSKSRSLQPDHDTSRIIDKNDKDDLPIESGPHGEVETREGETEDRV